MTWLAIILFVMQHVPDIIEIVKEILSLVHSLPHAERAEARKQLSDAIGSNDLAKVREVATQLKAKCEGFACPADLVGE